jgi:hypothetical protein
MTNIRTYCYYAKYELLIYTNWLTACIGKDIPCIYGQAHNMIIHNSRSHKYICLLIISWFNPKKQNAKQFIHKCTGYDFTTVGLVIMFMLIYLNSQSVFKYHWFIAFALLMEYCHRPKYVITVNERGSRCPQDTLYSSYKVWISKYI